MLDKIRLTAAGQLEPGYVLGEDPTCFDARCTHFLRVNYGAMAHRARQGGSDEEILDWCFEHGRKPSEEEILFFNSFLAKRGWRDESSSELEAVKAQAGLGDRLDIQTWIDLHEAEEGGRPGSSG